jgi:hypothetical protein
MSNQDADYGRGELPAFDQEFIADLEALSTRADDMMAAYQELQTRYRSLESSYTIATEEAHRLATELDLVNEENRKTQKKLRLDRDDAQTDLAMMKGDVTAVASTLVNSINGMRRRAAERAKARNPLPGAPQRPVRRDGETGAVVDLDDPSHLRMFNRQA